MGENESTRGVFSSLVLCVSASRSWAWALQKLAQKIENIIISGQATQSHGVNNFFPNMDRFWTPEED